MPKAQLHQRLTDAQVKDILQKYEEGILTGTDAARYLDVGRTRFYQLVRAHAESRRRFSIAYGRTTSNHRIDSAIEKHILKELAFEKEKIIDNPNVPTRRYNYSYLRDLLAEKYGERVSTPTIIARAKAHGFWKGRPPKKVHDREVITNHVGELIQHDSSHHLFAPDAKEKWYLITSLDDYSRALLYADFVQSETTWTHISAAESLILGYGFPYSYYVDQLAVFRYVKDRDKQTVWTTYQKFTDDVDPQWKQVMRECGVKVIYALSPQAKGKIERPYEWLQDRIVRTCVRGGVTSITEGQKILQAEVRAYNTARVHSTTGEIPMARFRTAITGKKTLFRDFAIPEPFQSVSDIFSLRINRTVDAYRTVSLDNYKMKVSGVMPREEVELRLRPEAKAGAVEVRIWHEGQLKDIQRVKSADLPSVHV